MTNRFAPETAEVPRAPHPRGVPPLRGPAAEPQYPVKADHVRKTAVLDKQEVFHFHVSDSECTFMNYRPYSSDLTIDWSLNKSS